MPSLPTEISTTWIMGALLAFFIKHYVADFVLQTRWMALGKERKNQWFAPLFLHSVIHGLLTTAIFAVAAPHLLWIGLVDAVIHFAIDRTKAIAGGSWKLTPTATGFWWMLGADQTLHHITHTVFALMIAVAHTPVSAV